MINFIIGMTVGVAIGVAVMAFCNAASKADDELNKIYTERADIDRKDD